jgi:hypothetical protein
VVMAGRVTTAGEVKRCGRRRTAEAAAAGASPRRRRRRTFARRFTRARQHLSSPFSFYFLHLSSPVLYRALCDRSQIPWHIERRHSRVQGLLEPFLSTFCAWPHLRPVLYSTVVVFLRATVFANGCTVPGRLYFNPFFQISAN